MNGQRKHRCVLALHLSARGLAFCVFDAPGSLHDWGLKRVEELVALIGRGAREDLEALERDSISGRDGLGRRKAQS